MEELEPEHGVGLAGGRRHIVAAFAPPKVTSASMLIGIGGNGLNFHKTLDLLRRAAKVATEITLLDVPPCGCLSSSVKPVASFCGKAANQQSK